MVQTTGPAPSFGFNDDDPTEFGLEANRGYDGPTRTEYDSLGSMEVSVDAYWGIHTARALQNLSLIHI